LDVSGGPALSELNFDRPEWAALTREAPVDPQRRIIDPHHHLWAESSWTYLLDDLLGDTGATHNVTDTVFMECRSSYREVGSDELRPVGETEFAAVQAQASEGSGTRIAGIVGFADLTLGVGVEAVLQAHEIAGQGRFRGIRHITSWDPSPRLQLGRKNNPDLMSDPAFRRGLVRLGELNYTFDAWVYHPQLPQMVDLARAAEETTIVLDHLGGPLGVDPYTNRDAVRSQWRSSMRALGDCPNVVVKLGGVGMDSVFGMGWSTRERPPGSDEVVQWWGDDIRWCIDTFGPARCMFESNYPVDRMSLGYGVIWNAFQKIASSYTSDEQEDLFVDTAARVYRISE
jgi:L-fuconolactonase